MQYKISIYDENGVIKASGVNSVSFAATPTSIFDASSVNTAGAVSLTLSMDNQSANTVLAGPTSGGAATPAFRALVADDLGTVLTSPPVIGTVTPNTGYFSALRLFIGGFFGIFTHSNSADRTYTLPNYNGTLATLAGTETLSDKTLTTPTIASFTNATHNHTNAAGGGQITDAALSAAVGVAKGGLGITTTPTNGQIPIGNGTNYVAANITGSSGVTVTNGGGTIALSAPTLAWHELVANTIIGVDGTFDLTSISGNYDHLVLVCQVRSDRAGQNNDNVYVRLNNDSTAGNYYGNFATLTTAYGNTERLGVTATGFELKGAASGATSPAGYRPGWMFFIYNYTVTAISKQISLTGGGSLGDSTGLITAYTGSGVWKNTSAAVNRITVLPVNGTNFTAGSSYALYGIGTP